MKIALCLSGYVRTYERAYEAACKHLLDKHDVDTFIYTWDERWSAGNGNHEKDLMKHDQQSTWEVRDDIVQKYKPAAMEIVTQPGFKNSNFCDGQPGIKNKIIGTKSMYYGIQQCDRLRLKHQVLNALDYDLVVRSRFDNVYNDIDLHACVPGKLNVPAFNNYKDLGGVNDTFWAADDLTMTKVSCAYKRIEEILATIPIHHWDRDRIPVNELVIGNQAQWAHVEVARHDWNISVIRRNGKMANFYHKHY